MVRVYLGSISISSAAILAIAGAIPRAICHLLPALQGLCSGHSDKTAFQPDDKHSACLGPCQPHAKWAALVRSLHLSCKKLANVASRASHNGQDQMLQCQAGGCLADVARYSIVSSVSLP